MKKLLYPVVVLMLLCFGCHKDKKIIPGGGGNADLQIQVVQGNNQKDTIGNLLHDSIVVKILSNGAPANNYTVQFKRSGCEDIQVTPKNTSINGQATFGWYLSGQVGAQLLNIVATDADGINKDSVTVLATGLQPGKGWHRSGCVQNFPVNDVTELGSGRLLCSLNGNNYPYYSDDNAQSWHPLKAFSNNYFIAKIVPGQQDDIFLATLNDGIFYSNDNGQTWQNRSNGINDPSGLSDIAFTKTGMLVCSNNSGVYTSPDKGQNWTENDYGLPIGQSSYPCQTTNGDLYIVGADNELYKLANGATKWVNLGSSAGNVLLSNVESVFVDNNDNIFIGTPHDGIGATGVIYRSSDGGATWAPVFSATSINNSYPNITQMSKTGSTYYFSFSGRGIYQTNTFSNFINVTTRFAAYGSLSYTVAPNSSLVLGSPGYGVFYYLQ
ncbi:MAG: hypothetical protein JST19_16465 [Bacteroidetes bacterium]|nr:hypothetical protein [Bacteroidota bacterium]